METLLAQDQYRVSSKVILNDEDRRILSMLYQPIIGHVALSIYHSLWAELEREKMIGLSSIHQRILNILDMNIEVFEKERYKLEALGLLRVFRKQNGPKKEYIYQIYSPLSANQFFHNQLLNTLLSKLLTQVEYEKTRYFFTTVDIVKDNYVDVTKSFKEIYSVHLDEKDVRQILQMNIEYKENVSQPIALVYDTKTLYKHLKEYQIKKSFITHDIEQYIIQLGTLYQIEPYDMVLLIIKSIQDETLHLDILSQEAQKFYDFEISGTLEKIHNKQPLKYQNANGNDKKTQYMHYLETVSPYQLLFDIQGSEPVSRDLKIIESIMNKQKLNPGVMNVLIELAMKLNDYQLVKPYMESIAASWARKKIVTVSQAMDESIKIRDSKREQSGYTPTKKKKSEKSEIDKEAVLEKIRKLYEEEQ